MLLAAAFFVAPLLFFTGLTKLSKSRCFSYRTGKICIAFSSNSSGRSLEKLSMNF